MRRFGMMAVIIGASLAAVAACKPIEVKPVYVDSGCIAFQPIILNDTDRAMVQSGAISIELVRQLLVHNKVGEERCGWQPRIRPKPT